MSHIFISYARSDETVAAQIADELRAARYEVWRDDELPAHRSYADVIEERIKGAAAVVVLWSAEAAKSQWVRAEADAARSTLTLIQVSLDGTIPPLPFNQIQCADLGGWDGQGNAPGWRKLLASVSELAGSREEPGERSREATRDVSICVLPFQNMSGDAEQEYFSDGISEDITTDLSKVSALEVIARNTAFTFKGQSVNVREVAKQLGVTHVLEGSVRKVGNKVRITAQLIEGRSGGHVWADRFDRDLTDIFEIQDEISKAIVKALKIKLLPEEKKAIQQRETSSPEAYNWFLLARQFWVTGNHGDQRREERVMRICQRAVELDPYYGRAWALLGMAQSNLHFGFGCKDVDDGVAAANAALAVNPAIAEAHLPMVRRLEERKRFAEAAEEIAKALRLAPDSWEVNKEAGRLRKARRDFTEAVAHYEKAVEAMDSDFHAWALLVTCCKALGKETKVMHCARKMVSEAERALQQDPSNGAALGIIAGGYAILGESARARDWIDRAILIDPDNLNMRYNFACILAAYVGDRAESLHLLQRVLATCSDMLVRVADSDPDLDGLRDNPRFQRMISDAKARVGIDLEPAANSTVKP
jgi:adenylate cyclase